MTALAPEKRTKDRHPRRVALREQLQMPTIAPDAITAYRPQASELAERIIERVTHEVSGFTDPDDPSIAFGVTEAIRSAVDLFVDAAAGAPTTGTEVYAFYRWLGRHEATACHNLDAMRAAHHIATQESWDDLRRATTELGLSAEVIGSLGDSLIAFQNALFTEALRGFTEAGREQQSSGAHAQLLTALLSAERSEPIKTLAERAGWVMPARIAVVVGHATTVAITQAKGFPGSLIGVRDDTVTVVLPATSAEEAARAIAQAGNAPAAVSWGVSPHEAHHAHRWARRALAMATSGAVTLPDDRVVRCRDMQTLLCLHADPALRRYSDEMVLAPLAAETRGRRRALADTMLLWLQTHDSAPALAQRLGVHDQTVRHRIRRLKELFGERLEDPTETVGLLLALESATPRWRAACD